MHAYIILDESYRYILPSSSRLGLVVLGKASGRQHRCGLMLYPTRLCANKHAMCVYTSCQGLPTVAAWSSTDVAAAETAKAPPSQHSYIQVAFSRSFPLHIRFTHRIHSSCPILPRLLARRRLLLPPFQAAQSLCRQPRRVVAIPASKAWISQREYIIDTYDATVVY